MTTLTGDRLASHQTRTQEKLYHHIFSTPNQPKSVSEHLRHDPVLWLNHHTFEELPDALDYIVDPNRDQSGMKKTIKTSVSMTLQNLLDWAKCFLATYEEYPSLYDLLDTPRHVY